MPGRVLLVDDDAMECELVQGVVAVTGMDIQVERTSPGAASRLQADKFDLLLFDFEMSSANGVDLVRLARGSTSNRDTPIVLMSDDPSPSAVSRAFDAGASFFLYKPVDKNRLQALLRASQGALEQERRRFRRVPLQTRVTLGYQGQQIEAETINVSLNGMLLKAAVDIATGMRVDVTMYLGSDPKPIVCSGTVMRTLNGSRMGVLMEQVSPVDNLRLQDFLLPMILQDSSKEHAVA